MNELHHLFSSLKTILTPVLIAQSNKRMISCLTFRKFILCHGSWKRNREISLLNRELDYIKRHFPAASKVELYVNRFNPSVDLQTKHGIYYRKHQGPSL